MKKLLLIVFLFTSMGAYSQVVIDENIHADIPDKKEYKEEKKKSAEEGEEEKMLSNKQSSLNFDYQFLDGGYGLGIGLAWKHLLLNYSLKSGETQSPVTENSGWDVGIGAHYRFWYKNLLFLDCVSLIDNKNYRLIGNSSTLQKNKLVDIPLPPACIYQNTTMTINLNPMGISDFLFLRKSV